MFKIMFFSLGLTCFSNSLFAEVYYNKIEVHPDNSVYSLNFEYMATERHCVPYWDNISKIWDAFCETTEIGMKKVSFEIIFENKSNISFAPFTMKFGILPQKQGPFDRNDNYRVDLITNNGDTTRLQDLPFVILENTHARNEKTRKVFEFVPEPSAKGLIFDPQITAAENSLFQLSMKSQLRTDALKLKLEHILFLNNSGSQITFIGINELSNIVKWVDGNTVLPITKSLITSSQCNNVDAYKWPSCIQKFERNQLRDVVKTVQQKQVRLNVGYSLIAEEGFYLINRYYSVASGAIEVQQ